MISPSPANNYQCYFSHYCRMTLIRLNKVGSTADVVAMILQVPLHRYSADIIDVELLLKAARLDLC